MPIRYHCGVAWCFAVLLTAACGSDAGAPGGGNAGGGGGSVTGGAAGAVKGGQAGEAGHGGVAGDAGHTGQAGAAGQAGQGGNAGCAPTLHYTFALPDETSFDARHQASGSVLFGADDGSSADGAQAWLTFPGDPSLNFDDRVSPEYASEISTKQALAFGTYRARVRLGECATTEELVNGIFVYSHEGVDLNNNGMEDNNEIDIEILCSEPYFVWLTSWTDYTDDTHMRKSTRGINFQTGEYYETPQGAEGTYELELAGSDPAFKKPGFPAAGAWLEMGFRWSSEKITWFMLVEGQETVLWEFTDAALIPQNAAYMMFNLWHPSSHWWAEGNGDYPSADSTLRVDSLKFWSETSCQP